MLVDVADEEHPRGAGARRGDHLPKGPGGFRGHEPVEEAGRVGLPGFVIQDQRDPAGEIGARPVIPAVGGRLDAEPGECHGPLGLRGRGEALGIEALAELDRLDDGPLDLQPVPLTQRAVGEPIVLEEGAPGSLEPGPCEAARDELRGQAVLRSLAEPPLHAVRGEEEQVGPKVGGGDGLHLRRPRVLGLARGRRAATRTESAISALQRGWLRIVIPPERGESIRGRAAREGYDFAP